MAARGRYCPARRRPDGGVGVSLGGSGLQITSTVQEVDPPRRIVWSGPAQGITAIHVWEFTPTDHGVLVHTEESWDGEVVRAQTATLQQALDGSLRAWLTNLKHAAEQAGR
jgi:hypothetical protein